MKGREIVIAVITAVVVLLASAGVQKLMDTSSAGVDAAAKDQINEVVDGRLKTDTGSTYAQELRSINETLIRYEVQIGALTRAVEKLTE